MATIDFEQSKLIPSSTKILSIEEINETSTRIAETHLDKLLGLVANIPDEKSIPERDAILIQSATVLHDFELLVEFVMGHANALNLQFKELQRSKKFKINLLPTQKTAFKNAGDLTEMVKNMKTTLEEMRNHEKYGQRKKPVNRSRNLFSNFIPIIEEVGNGRIVQKKDLDKEVETLLIDLKKIKIMFGLFRVLKKNMLNLRYN